MPVQVGQRNADGGILEDLPPARFAFAQPIFCLSPFQLRSRPYGKDLQHGFSELWIGDRAIIKHHHQAEGTAARIKKCCTHIPFDLHVYQQAILRKQSLHPARV